jgi:calcineurin-like phosphoesterase family protein
MKIWLTTDTHFNHALLVDIGARPRGFEQPIMRGLSRIPAGDVLIHLGDICIGGDDGVHAMLASLPFKKWLVRGNHDHKSWSWYMAHGWDFVGDTVSLELFGKDILLSHMPQPDTGYDLNIHGHFHNTDHHRWEPELISVLNDKQVLLAIENTNYQPVPLETVVARRI